jgi:hypothetical protein
LIKNGLLFGLSLVDLAFQSFLSKGVLAEEFEAEIQLAKRDSEMLITGESERIVVDVF